MSKRRRYSNEGRLPVGRYSGAQLHDFLVEDACRLHATNLLWAVEAYERIGLLSGRGAEAAYQDVRAAVFARTGRTLMPVG